MRNQGGTWTGDLLVIDREDLERADNASDVCARRFKSGQVVIQTPKNGTGNFIFPVAEGNFRQPPDSASQINELYGQQRYLNCKMSMMNRSWKKKFHICKTTSQPRADVHFRKRKGRQVLKSAHQIPGASITESSYATMIYLVRNYINWIQRHARFLCIT